MLAVGIVGMVAGCAGADVSVAPEVAPFEERQAAAQFDVDALVGDGRVSLEQFEGSPVFLNFWASWCGPCREEMPDLQAFQEAHPEIAVVGLAVRDDPDDSRRFARRTGVEFPLGIDRQGEVAGRYAALSLPVTVVIDAEGRIANTWFGLIRPEQLEELAAQLA